MKVRIIESVFENGVAVHKKDEVKDVDGAAGKFLTVRGWATELTPAEIEELDAGGDGDADGVDKREGEKKGRKSKKTQD
jgi:hypothetical protein